MTTFFVPGVPVPQGSMTAVVRGGRAVLFSANRSLHTWRRDVALIARSAHHGAPYAGPCAVRATFVLMRPKSVKKRPYPSVKPDADKLLRAAFDSITDAGVWVDDALAVLISVRKVYGDEPGVRIAVREL